MLPPKSPPVTAVVRRSFPPRSNLSRKSKTKKSPSLSKVYVSPVNKATENTQINSTLPDYSANETNSTTYNIMIYLLKFMQYLFIAGVLFDFSTIQTYIGRQQLTGGNVTYALCSEIDSHKAIPTVTCIRDDEISATFDLVWIIGPILHDMAIEHKCKDETKPYLLSAVDIIRIAIYHSNETRNEQVIIKFTNLLRNIEYLIDQNPKGLLCNVNDEGIKLNFTEVLNMRSECANSFAVLQPRIPLACANNYEPNIFFSLLRGICIALVVWWHLCWMWNYLKMEFNQI